MKKVFEFIVTLVFMFLLFGGILANALTGYKFPILIVITGLEIIFITFILFCVIMSWVEKILKD